MIGIRERLRIGEMLMRRGTVSADQLSEALEQHRATGRRLGECLLELGYVSEDSVIDALAEQLRLERVELARLEVPEAATQTVPLEFVRRHRILPLSLQNSTIRIVTADPGNRQVVEDIRLLTGLEVEETVASEKEIRAKISECYQITVERMIEDLHPTKTDAADREDLHDVELMASEPTVVNLVNLIISTALRERASDIHLVPFDDSLELRYRVDGLLRIQPPPPKHLHPALVSRIKIMADMNIAERFLPQDGHIQIQHRAHRVDIRVGTMPTIYGESVVMRLLEKDAGVQNFEELGLDRERAEVMMQLVSKSYGIFLATGPTGCGKTTTLYSLLKGTYTPEKKILTIEDPVEYELKGVAQISVRPTRGFTFATGLRAILRQDPDVVMVGEIRDFETAEIAIRAALTGHVVFSTLHTNDAAGAVTRLVDMGIESFLISSSLEGVLAQRLVRRICPHCKREGPLSDSTLYKLETLGMVPGDGPCYYGEGCEECSHTGYRGRMGLFELLVINPALRDLILKKRSSGEIKAAAAKDMITIREDGFRKAAAGLTTFDEVLRVALGESFAT